MAVVAILSTSVIAVLEFARHTARRALFEEHDTRADSTQRHATACESKARFEFTRVRNWLRCSKPMQRLELSEEALLAFGALGSRSVPLIRAKFHARVPLNQIQ